MLLTNAFTLGEASPAVRFETSIVTSTIQDEEVMAVQLPTSVKRRRNRMAKDGSAGCRDTAGVSRKSDFLAKSLAKCTATPEVSKISATAMSFA